MSEDLTKRIWDIEDEKLGWMVKDVLHRVGIVNDDLLKTHLELLEVKRRLYALERPRRNLENSQN